MLNGFGVGRWWIGVAMLSAVAASFACGGVGSGAGEAEASPDAPAVDAPVERKRGGRGRRSPAPAPDPAPGGGGTGQGSVAYSAYDSGSKLISFVSDHGAKVTWANMTGSAVTGEFTQSGDEIVVQWDPNADNYGSLETRFHQTSPCSLSQYWRKDKEGVVHDGESTLYVRQTPECLRR